MSDSPPPPTGVDFTIKLNELDVTRAVEQAAIVSSLLAGRGLRTNRSHRTERSPGRRRRNRERPQPKSAYEIGGKFLLGALDHAPCHGRIVHLDRERTNGKRALERDIGRMVGHGDDWRLDFVVSPIDGVRDLLEGRDSGSVSIVSGGPAGVFEPSHPDLREGQIGHANRYLLTVVPPHRGGVDDPEGLVKEIGRDLPSEAYAPREFLSRSAILSRVRSLVEGTKAPAEMTVATILPTRPAKKGENRDLTPIIGDVARTRSHCGSSVMAAIQTFYSTLGVDAYLGVVRRTHAVLIAASSHSMRGGFVAFPIDESGKVIARPFTAADFLTTTIADAPVDLFVAATGISETLVLEGVRFRDRSSVATHTLCLRSRTRSSRLIKHQHDLDRKRFHMLDRRSTKTLSFESVLDSLEKYVRTNA